MEIAHLRAVRVERAKDAAELTNVDLLIVVSDPGIVNLVATTSGAVVENAVGGVQAVVAEDAEAAVEAESAAQVGIPVTETKVTMG